MTCIPTYACMTLFFILEYSLFKIDWFIIHIKFYKFKGIECDVKFVNQTQELVSKNK